MNRASRRPQSPALVGPRWPSSWPEESAAGTSPGEGAHRGQVGESCWVAESSEDLGCADAAVAGYRAHDPGWVGLVVERADALVEPVDLVGQGQCEPGLGGDIGGQRVEVELAAVCCPQPQRGRGGFDDCV